jgi:hypothetical protein
MAETITDVDAVSNPNARRPDRNEEENDRRMRTSERR